MITISDLNLTVITYPYSYKTPGYFLRRVLLETRQEELSPKILEHCNVLRFLSH